MSKPQMDQVGAGRAFPNPQDAVDRLGGLYRDNVAEVGLAEKLPTVAFPMVPCSSSLSIKSRVGGSR